MSSIFVNLCKDIVDFMNISPNHHCTFCRWLGLKHCPVHLSVLWWWIDFPAFGFVFAWQKLKEANLTMMLNESYTFGSVCQRGCATSFYSVFNQNSYFIICKQSRLIDGDFSEILHIIWKMKMNFSIALDRVACLRYMFVVCAWNCQLLNGI